MMKMRGIGVALVGLGMFMLMGDTACAQSAGQLRFRFEPDRGMEYVLDGKYKLSDKELTLTEGPHRFTFWAPERLMLDTTLFLVADRTQEVLIRLRYAQDYVDHRRAEERFVRQERWGTYLPPVITGGAAAWATVSFLNYRKASRELDDLADSYRTSADPAGIQRLKEQEIPDAKADLKSARTQTIVATGVFAASAAATLIIRKRLAERKAPVFEDKERIRFEGLVHQPMGNGGIWSATFSLPLR
jgi:hypothetical protein